jgi:hypothetical protein
VVKTPEGLVKDAIKLVLDAHKPELYYEMNVPTGYGKSGLDFIGAFYGQAFAIEAKARRKPTSRQDGTIEDMTKAGICVFVIDATECDDMTALRKWLDDVRVWWLRSREDVASS